ncbi:MAG: GspE/PulE family protein [Clostridium sp.]|jgi:type IV pilus assembly protein PilB|uniref:GspE/PulE family protein n=1 Tax=Clostridium sp. TaxID=1506 RepID=UPI0025B88D8C|nr:GspE/PulE family protein [Clostridium sp.]MCH3964169.1 GspE/PulE family protein [Clostridium sp.]MCI1715350.1 GspE/PulE family protein [Clostridium sp.]MCI1799859.1 GspE/PulE family protein [Clostridium sp.]MCI1813533.1 GspE/PulE family protein [Clostridium sp.]MCI1870677.1 GspE/PulE family protein [Clostridium sp.]
MKQIDLMNIEIDKKLSGILPEEIARENCMIAFKEIHDKIYIAIDKPPNFYLREKLRFMLKKDTLFFQSGRKYILKSIDNLYFREKLDFTINSIEINSTGIPEMGNSESTNSPVVKAANYIIQRAIDERASDIHIEPFETYINVRFRIDGIIGRYVKIPRDIYNFICMRIKIMANLDIAEKRMPQDGKIIFSSGGKDYDIRVSTLPTIYGEKIVLRILYKDRDISSFESLGFLKADVERIKRMIEYANGLILSVGPTGAGKSTTVYSLVHNIDWEKKNIVSIEDPVEYAMDGVNQVNVNSKIGLDFASGLRSILRQDPDVIMIGEIRDEETAKIAVKASITGHLVLSTLHTNSPQEAVLRLENMGVPSYFIKDALIGVISQRLVRKLCPYCRESYEMKSWDSINNFLNIDESQILYRSKGCFKCNYTGYTGRTAVYEIKSMKDDSLNSKSIKDNSIDLIKDGVTTFDEIMKLGI